MRKQWTVCLMFVLCFLSGCSTTINHNELTTSASQKLESRQKAYIALAQDGAYGEKTYTGSGSQVSHFLALCVRPNVSDIQIATSAESAETALASAKAAGMRYAFLPVISNWEPRAAAWSGIPTRVSMTITVHDFAANKSIVVRKIDVEGRTMTLVSQSADELAHTAIKQFCGEVF